MKNLFLVLCFYSLAQSVYSQGLVIQSGLTTAFSKDKNITAEGQAHYGWMVGADGRILEGDMYFIIGAQYHNSNLASTGKINFFDTDWSMLMFRAGLGFNIFKMSEKTYFRTKIVGSVNSNLTFPKGALNKTGYDKINDSFLGGVSGLGFTQGPFDIDFEYQYGIINAYTGQPNSTFSFFTLMAGFHF
jgi:hypothetical protein